MKVPQQQQTLRTDEEATIVVGGEEATRVSPRFDDEETLVARPVVPLTETPEASAEEPTPAPTAPRVARPAYARRPSWPLALMLVSVLIGGVLGGAGIYFYQRQSGEEAAAPAQPEMTAAEAPRPSDEPAAQTAPAPTPAPTEAPVAEAQTPAPAPAPDGEADATRETATPARAPEITPVAERRDAPAEAASKGAPKRGKKDEREQEVERRARPRDDDDGPVADSEAPRARRVDSILYRQRRADRRAAPRARREAAADTDRVRRIFEGSPQ